jgi:hypothetical protein
VKKYRVPDKMLSRWIRSLDECIVKWEKLSRGEDASYDCAACTLETELAEADICECPLRGKNATEAMDDADWCCDGIYKTYINTECPSRRDSIASQVLAFIKSRRAGLIKRQKALKAKKVSK